jgi:hypothetical protein
LLREISNKLDRLIGARSDADIERERWTFSRKEPAHAKPNQKITMNISKYRKPRFLKKEDCDPPIVLTVTGVEEMNVSGSAREPEYKLVLSLENDLRDRFRFTLNETNLQTVASFFGHETDDWLEQEIEFRFDPAVEFDGQVVGGIRIKGPAEEGIPF